MSICVAKAAEVERRLGIWPNEKDFIMCIDNFRDVTIARDGKRGLESANDVTYRKRAEGFGRF